MFIKTVSTTSGINPIKFDETGGVFYWILNTGSTTIYASTKSAFTAGDDGVVSLGPKESRRLETNNDTIYILGEGQVEIHNQRDGICSFKQAPTSSGGGGTIDAYTKTESDAKYAQKTDIPSSLPANGGNADTVDDYHVSELMHSSTSTPPEYFTNVARIDHTNKRIESWNTDNIKVALADRATNAENADTVDGKHADEIYRSNSVAVDLNTIVGNGCYAVTPDSLNMPFKSWFVLHVDSYNNGQFVIQMVYQVGDTTNTSSYVRNFSNGNWSVWKEISTTPIKSTGWITMPTNAQGDINLPEGDSRKYLSVCSAPLFAFLYHTGSAYIAHIKAGDMAVVQSTPVTYIAFYID